MEQIYSRDVERYLKNTINPSMQMIEYAHKLASERVTCVCPTCFGLGEVIPFRPIEAER